MTRPALLVAVAVAAVVGCQGKELTVFGYSTEPPFDPDIRSVYIPVFKNAAFTTNPHRGIEVDVTESIVQQLGRRRTPMRVVSDPARADTELIGTITSISKVTTNRNVQNYAREDELVITAEVVWRDLRSGRVLNNSRQPAPPPSAPFDPSLPQPPPPPPEPLATPVRLTAVGRILPELGESNASAEKAAADMLARQVVNLMEKPW